MKSFLNDLRRMISKSLGEMVDDKRLRGLSPSCAFAILKG